MRYVASAVPYNTHISSIGIAFYATPYRGRSKPLPYKYAPPFIVGDDACDIP
jgi:hypothetical protein